LVDEGLQRLLAYAAHESVFEGDRLINREHGFRELRTVVPEAVSRSQMIASRFEAVGEERDSVVVGVTGGQQESVNFY
jgi:hypothetical protein